MGAAVTEAYMTSLVDINFLLLPPIVARAETVPLQKTPFESVELVFRFLRLKILSRNSTKCRRPPSHHSFVSIFGTLDGLGGH